MEFKDIVIGQKYKVIKNRDTFYGKCGDIIEFEDQEIKVDSVGYDNEIYFTSKNGKHVCKAENLEPIKIKQEEKRNKVYIYEALPCKINWKVTHNNEVTYTSTEFEDFSYKLILNGNATIFILNDEFKGVAKCLPTDTYDVNRGKDIAYMKSLIKACEKKLKELTK